MKKEPLIIGYVVSGALPAVSLEAARRLTHMNVAFGHILEGKVSTKSTKNLEYLPRLKEYNPDLRILLSVGGWGAGGFSAAASSSSGIENVVKTSLAVLKENHLDGIDLDWEYPCYYVAGIDSSPKDKENFTLLLKALREALDEQGKADNRYYLLTIAAGADQYYIDGTSMAEAQQYLDWVQLMTYDMRGGFQTLTGHHTNLFPSTGDLFRISVDSSTKMFLNAGVPREKIVIGAAFYSRMWKDVPNSHQGLFQMTQASGGYGPSYKDLVENYVDKNDYVRYWDPEAQAPYLFNGNTFISYDDEESITAKCNYLQKEGLAGIMFWEYSCDPSGLLLQTMHKALREKE